MVIYKTTNLVNGKQYIGRDKYNNPNYFGSGRLLKKAVRKYGKENFKKEILEVCSSFEHMVEREEYWLNHYDAGNNKMFYNMHNNGAGGMGVSGEKHYMYGKHHTEERKRKWSESRKGEKNGMYGKGYLLAGEKNYWYGKHLPEEVRRKISESRQGEKHPNYGKKYSDELKQKISEGNKGKIFSDETRRRMSEAAKGKIISDETRKKMSESQRKRDNSGEKNPMFGKQGFWSGKHRSDETKRKLSKSHTGKKLSDEHKRKISEVLTGEKNPYFKGYVVCVDGNYVGQKHTTSNWSSILGISCAHIYSHLNGKKYKNGIKGNFLKREQEL